MDIDSPPAHDSPKNILNILVDDCIEQILRLVLSRDINDFFSAAATCKRFQETAKSFESEFRSIAIGTGSPILVNHVPMVLRHFGHLIESITWKPEGNSENNDKIFNLIGKYCGKTLRELTVHEYNPTVNEGNPFPALQTLILKNGSYNCSEPWFIRPFPSLMRVEFNEMCDLTECMLTAFMSSNPQLQSLSIDNCDRVPPIFLLCTASHSRNLRHLSIIDNSFGNFNDDGIPVDIEPFFPINNTLVDLRIKVLIYERIPDKFLFNLIKSLTALRTLSVSNMDPYIDSSVALTSLLIIENILEYGRALTEFQYETTRGDINLENYNRILSLAENRVKVQLTVGMFDVPDDILTANKAWVKLEKALALASASLDLSGFGNGFLVDFMLDYVGQRVDEEVEEFGEYGEFEEAEELEEAEEGEAWAKEFGAWFGEFKE